MRLMPGGTAWLSLTPEPERDLPAAIATLRVGGRPSPEAIEAERERAESLVLRGSRRRWAAWLNEGLELADEASPENPDVAAARELLLDVIENHHALEQGLPDRGRSPAGDRDGELLSRVWAGTGKDRK